MILLGVVRNEMSAAADELIATGDRWQRSYQHGNGRSSIETG